MVRAIANTQVPRDEERPLSPNAQKLLSVIQKLHDSNAPDELVRELDAMETFGGALGDTQRPQAMVGGQPYLTAMSPATWDI